MKQSHFKSVAILALTLNILTVGAYAASVEKDKNEIKRQTVDLSKEGTEAVSKFNMDAVSKALKISKSEISSFFKAEKKIGKLNSQASSAWREILKRVTMNGIQNPKAVDFENAEAVSEAVSAYIKIKSSNLVDNIHIDAIQIADAARTWTVEQKTNFAKTLRAAVRIAETDPSVTESEQAFEKALDQMGILGKYRKGCKN